MKPIISPLCVLCALSVAGGLIFLSGTNDLEAARDSPGKKDFDKAYAIEKTLPAQAIVAYWRALGLGLDDKYRQLVWWRLRGLHRAAGEPDFEYLAIARIANFAPSDEVKARREKLRAQLGTELKLVGPEWDAYFEGLSFYFTAPDKSLRHWAQAENNGPYSERIAARLLPLLIAADKRAGTDRALRYLERSAGGLSKGTLRLRRAETLLGLDRADQGIAEIVAWLEERPAGEKPDGQSGDYGEYFAYWTLGKIYQKKKGWHQAYVCFRLSAEVAKSPDAAIEMAAYMQFLAGREAAAWALIRKTKPRPGMGVILFDTLSYAIGGNSEALDRLRDRRPELRRLAAEKPNSLIARALKLAR